MPHRPGHQETSFFNTISELGKQRAGIPRRKLEPKRPVAQPPRTPAVRPTQEGPSFAQTMGQVGQQRWEENLGRNVRDDAAIAGGYGYRNPTDPGVVLAQTLGMDHVSPAGQENFARNAARHYPNQLFYAGGGRPNPTGNINRSNIPLQVAPMLDVFRNDPAAMRALPRGEGSFYGGYPGYTPEFTASRQIASPWDPWNPVFGGMAATQYGPTNLGSWYGRGTWDQTGIGNTSPFGAPLWYTDARGSNNSRFINPRRTGNFMSGY